MLFASLSLAHSYYPRPVSCVEKLHQCRDELVLAQRIANGFTQCLADAEVCLSKSDADENTVRCNDAWRVCVKDLY